MIDRFYAIIPVSQVSKIKFYEILQTSKETLRYSLDKSKAVIKWSETEPSFLKEVDGLEGPYTHDEIILIMESTEWTDYSIILDSKKTVE